jgi:hypothetical protein
MKTNYNKIFFSLTLATFSSLAIGQEKVVVGSTIETNFSILYQQISKKLHAEYPSFFYRSCESGKADHYRCGEIPFGKLMDAEDGGDKKKLAFTVKIPSQSFNKSGYKGTFPATSFPIHMTRAQISGAPIAEELITEPGEKQISSGYLGKDLYMRLFSKNNQLFTTACIYSPGVKIDAPLQVIKFTAKKDLYLTSLKSDVKTKIQITPFSFESMKSCISLRVLPKVDGKNITYEAEIIAIEKPTIIGFKKGEIKVDVDVSGGNFLGSLVNSFIEDPVSDAIEKAIKDKMSDKVDQFVKKDMQTGDWVRKFLNASYHDYLTNNIGKKIREAMSQQYIPETTMGDSIYKQCNSIVSKISGLDPYRKAEFAKDCLDFQNITFKSFLADANSTAQKCYVDYTRVTEIDPVTKPKIKALVDCKFNHTIEFSVKPYLKPLANCLANQWKEDFTGDCSSEVSTVAASLGIK